MLITLLLSQHVFAGTPFTDGLYEGKGISYSKTKQTSRTISGTLEIKGNIAKGNIHHPNKKRQRNLYAKFDDLGFFKLHELIDDRPGAQIGIGFCGETACQYTNTFQFDQSCDDETCPNQNSIQRFGTWLGRAFKQGGSRFVISLRESLTLLPNGDILAIGHIKSPKFESAWEMTYKLKK